MKRQEGGSKKTFSQNSAINLVLMHFLPLYPSEKHTYSYMTCAVEVKMKRETINQMNVPNLGI